MRFRNAERDVLWAAAAGFAAALLFLAGCSTSSPRFRTPGVPPEEDPENEIRFASKIREEETREGQRRVAPRPARSAHEERIPGGINRDRVLLEAVAFLGVPYEYGGNSKEGIDCSGYTSMVYEKAANVALPRTASGQFGAGKDVDRDSLLFGDLVFFNTTGRSPSHVGIYIEDGLFSHASVTYGVTISSLDSKYYRDRYVGAKRIVGD